MKKKTKTHRSAAKERVRQDALADAKFLELEQRHKETEKKYKTLLAEYNKALGLLRAHSQYKSERQRKHTIRAKRGGKHYVVPILVLSDWHVEEEVKPSVVGGKNAYNPQIAKERAERVFTAFLRRVGELEEKVDTVAVFLLGDFITGQIHTENIENATKGKVSALRFAEELISAGINLILGKTKCRVILYCKVGNHSRTTDEVRASTEWENSLEPLMYYSLCDRHSASGRVECVLEESYISYARILNTTIRYHHGHAIRYSHGVGGLHIPLRKAVRAWNETKPADCDILGHFHNFTENTTFRYIVNGSLIGYTAYAERLRASYERPLQAYAVVHEKHGLIRVSPLYADDK